MKISEYISGKYEQQYEYKSFLPERINHAWHVDEPELITLLDDANRLLGELNAFSQLVPDVDFFIKMHITKEATTSSRIEGTRTNMEEALVDVQDVDPERRDDWEEVQNYIKAVNFSIERLQSLPLSTRLLRETHKVLMQGVRGEQKLPGEFRKSQNWLGPSLKKAVFVPPHHEQLAELMTDLENFIHNDEIHVPHLIRVGILHYQFETIHPFLDGNGRLGRLLIALYLANFNLLHKPALYLSDYFERNRLDYYDHLTVARTKNELSAWLRFFLIGVHDTAETSIGVFKAILELKERIEREIMPQFHTRRQANAQALMRFLYQSPVVNIKRVKALLDVQTNTASSLISAFEEFRILEEKTGYKRNRTFVFSEYMQMFK
ncbi:MAG: Fic family protein [Desulfocapsa sp.]|nr:Fic family protein [Desulfocapsa sp.]